MTKGTSRRAKQGNTFRPPAGSPGRQERQASGCAVCGVRQGFQGKRQLSWSNGLKAKFNLVEKDDEELAAELEDSAELLGLISLTNGEMFSRSRHGLPCLSWRLLLAGLLSKSF